MILFHESNSPKERRNTMAKETYFTFWQFTHSLGVQTIPKRSLRLILDTLLLKYKDILATLICKYLEIIRF